MNSSVRVAEDDTCSTGSDTVDYIPGPATASVTINAYAFEKGQDKWLGRTCKGQAQASQSNTVRYDGTTDKHIMIPTKIHRAQIVGDLGDSVSLGKVFFKGVNVEANTPNGVAITTEMETWLGAEFSYIGAPLPIQIPDLKPYSINIGESSTDLAYIASISVNMDFPQPATVSYTFEFVLPKSEE